MAKYPHMKPKETMIWDRFLARLPWEAVDIRYDLRVGEGARPAAGSPDWVNRMVYALSTKRIDAVVETRDEIIIVEVKERAALSATGQLLGYLALFVRQERPQKPVRLVCVAERVAPDMEIIFGEYGIETYLV